MIALKDCNISDQIVPPVTSNQVNSAANQNINANFECVAKDSVDWFSEFRSLKSNSPVKLKPSSVIANMYFSEFILMDMAEWCISSKNMAFNQKFKSEDEKQKYLAYFHERSKTALVILTNSSIKIRDLLSKSQQFSQFLFDFLSSDDSNIEELSGKYALIITHVLSHSFPKESSRNPFNTIPCLFQMFGDRLLLVFVNRIYVHSIQDLLIDIFSTYPFLIRNPDSIILLLSQNASKIPENKTFLNNFELESARTLVSIYKQAVQIEQGSLKEMVFDNSQKNGYNFRSFLNSFRNSTVIENMLTAAINLNELSTLVSTDLIESVASILLQVPYLSSTVNLHQDILKISKDNITSLSIAGIDLFHSTFHELYQLFLDNESVHNKLLKMIKSINDRILKYSLSEIASIPNFIKDLISCYGTSKWCPHMMKLSMMFVRSNCKELRTKTWKKFAVGVVLPKIHLYKKGYGGKVPKEYDDFVERRISMDSESGDYSEYYSMYDEYEYNNFDEEESADNESEDFGYSPENDGIPEIFDFSDSSNDEFEIDI